MAFTTRRSLLFAVRRGDEVGWQEFYDMYKPLILLRGGDLRLNRSEREELVQLVMLAFFKSARTFVYDRSKGRFRDYLKRIIHNQACDLLRRRRDGEVSLESVAPQLEELPAEAEARWDAEWSKTLMDQAFEELKHRCNPTTLQSFDLFVRQGLPAKEVAQLLEIRPNAVYQHKARVEAMLREIVRQLDE